MWAWVSVSFRGCTTSVSLPLQARRLEGELDVKLAAFTKLCSSFEASYKLNTADNSLGADQVRGIPIGTPVRMALGALPCAMHPC